MTQKDMNKLWALVGTYRDGDPRLKNKALKAAWFLSLNPFDYEDLKQATAAQFREFSYWPDPSEIANRCPKLQLPAETKEPVQIDYRGDAKMEALRSEWEQKVPRRRAAGLPGTWTEAQAAGMTAAGWHEALEGAGLGLTGGAKC